MKIKKLAVTLYFVMIFSFTACKTNSIPQEKLNKNTNHENTPPKENIKTINKTVPEIKQENIKNSGNKGVSFIIKDNPNLMCKYYTQISGDYLFHTFLLYRNGSIANGTLGAKLSYSNCKLSSVNYIGGYYVFLHLY